MRTGIIYKATNLVNGKCYVGQTLKSLEHRKNKHASKARTSCESVYFAKAIRKYGIDGFVWEVLVKDVPIEQLNAAEMAAIKVFCSFGKNGYNSNAGGGGNYGYKHSEETKKKIAALKIGVRASEETRKKLSAARMGNKYSLGRRLTEDEKKKISATLSGRRQSEEHKKKNSLAHKGKVFSDEHRRKLSLAKIGILHSEQWKKQHSIDMMGEKNPMAGKHHSSKTLEKISVSQKGKKLSPEQRERISKGLLRFYRPELFGANA